MARVTYGPMITNIRGSIGGVTFQSNRSGAIARLRPAPPKTRTPKQSTRISEFSNLATEWRKLTLQQKVLWNDYGLANPKISKFGELKILTGYNYFQSLNFWRLQTAQAILVVPPPFIIPAPATDFGVTLGALALTKDFVTAPLAANLRYIQYTSAPVLGNTPSNFNRMILSGIAAEDPPFPKDVTAGWNFFHGLDYLSLRATSQFNLGFMIQALDLNSGLTSAGLFKTFSF